MAVRARDGGSSLIHVCPFNNLCGRERPLIAQNALSPSTTYLSNYLLIFIYFAYPIHLSSSSSSCSSSWSFLASLLSRSLSRLVNAFNFPLMKPGPVDFRLPLSSIIVKPLVTPLLVVGLNGLRELAALVLALVFGRGISIPSPVCVRSMGVGGVILTKDGTGGVLLLSAPLLGARLYE